MNDKQLNALLARIELLEYMEARRLAFEAGKKPETNRGYFNNLREEILNKVNPQRGNLATDEFLQNAVDALIRSASEAWPTKADQ